MRTKSRANDIHTPHQTTQPPAQSRDLPVPSAPRTSPDTTDTRAADLAHNEITRPTHRAAETRHTKFASARPVPKSPPRPPFAPRNCVRARRAFQTSCAPSRPPTRPGNWAVADPEVDSGVGTVLGCSVPPARLNGALRGCSRIRPSWGTNRDGCARPGLPARLDKREAAGTANSGRGVESSSRSTSSARPGCVCGP